MSIEELKKAAALEIKARRFLPAADIYSKMIQLEPMEVTWYSNRSLCYSKYPDGFSDLAIMDALKCIELDPNFVKGYVRLAIAYYRDDKFEIAKQKFEEFLVKFPEAISFVNEVKTKWMPLVLHMDKFEKELEIPKCCNCIKSMTSVFQCSGCSYTLYCSKECQNQHWSKVHKHYCGASKNIKSTPLPWTPPKDESEVRRVNGENILIKIKCLNDESRYEQTIVECQRVLKVMDKNDQWYEAFLVQFSKALQFVGRKNEAIVTILNVKFNNLFNINDKNQYCNCLATIHDYVDPSSNLSFHFRSLVLLLNEFKRTKDLGLLRQLADVYSVCAISISDYVSNHPELDSLSKSYLFSDALFPLKKSKMACFEYQRLIKSEDPIKELARCYYNYGVVMNAKLKLQVFDSIETKEDVMFETKWNLKEADKQYDFLKNNLWRGFFFFLFFIFLLFLLGGVYGQLAIMHDTLGQYDEAIEMQKESVKFRRLTNHKQTLSAALSNLGARLSKAGNYLEL